MTKDASDVRSKRAWQPRWLRGVWLLASVPAGLTPWLPFYRDIHPWDYVSSLFHAGGFSNKWEVARVAIPFLLGVPIVVWKLRLMIRPGSYMWERGLLQVLAGGAMGLTGFLVVQPIPELTPAQGWGLLMVPLLVAMLAGGLNLLLSRRQWPAEFPTTVILYTPFLVNALIALIGLARHRNIGWTVTVLASVCLLIELMAIAMAAGFSKRKAASQGG